MAKPLKNSSQVIQDDAMLSKTQFKETEIGKIPEDWEVKSTEELVVSDKGSIKIGPFGSQLKKEFLVEAGYKLYGQENIFKNDFSLGDRYITEERFELLRSCELKPGDIIISMMGTIGFVAIVPKNIRQGIIDSHLLRIRINEKKFDKQFILYAFRSKIIQQQIDVLSVGTIMAGLSSKIIKQLLFPSPPLEDQRVIAKILSDLDAKIELKRQMNQTLEQIGHALFKRWFVDFEFPNEQGKPYKSSGGEMVDSELGPMPKGWKIKPIGEIANFIRGFSYKGSEKSQIPSDYIFITLNSVREGGGFKPEYAWIKSERLQGRHFVNEYDLIVANTEQTRDGTLLAFPAIVYFAIDYDKDKAVFSHHISKVNSEQPFKAFLYYFLKLTQRESIGYHTGSVIWALDTKNFELHRKVVCPPERILERFNLLSQNIFTKIAINERERINLEAIRDSLLPKLMSGQIRVKMTKESAN